MATAVVVPALRALDSEITSVAPRRTLPTWFAGDKAHKLRPSGHNADDTAGSKAEDSDSDSTPEIRAGDYRLPLNAPFSAETLVQYLVKACRAGKITWIKYIIFNKRIWSASTGWVTRAYTGSNPHDHHFHVSCKPDSKSENSTGKVGLSALIAKPAPSPAAGGKVVSVKVSANYPVIRQGASDYVPGYKTNLIHRAQAVLVYLGGYDGKLDGDYGPKMGAAVKKMMSGDAKRSSTNGSVIGEAEWRRLFGAWA